MEGSILTYSQFPCTDAQGLLFQQLPQSPDQLRRGMFSSQSYRLSLDDSTGRKKIEYVLLVTPSEGVDQRVARRPKPSLCLPLFEDFPTARRNEAPAYTY